MFFAVIDKVLEAKLAKNKDDLLEKVLCENEDRSYFKPECINMKCKSCGPWRVKDLVSEREKSKVKVRQWGMQEVEQEGKKTLKKRSSI